MAYHVDGVEAGEDPHVNYEPSSRSASLEVAPKAGKDYTPFVQGNVVRQTISRTNNYKQAGERYRSFEQWERDELISNLVGALRQCDRGIQERMINHLNECDAEYGQRVAEGLEINVSELKSDSAGAR
jgi:catalase